MTDEKQEQTNTENSGESSNTSDKASNAELEKTKCMTFPIQNKTKK